MTSDSDSQSSTRKRVLPRWLKVVLVLVALLLLAALTWLVLDTITRRRLNAVLADIRGRGWPTELADLYPAPIPDSENAAPLYRRALANGRFASKDTEWLDSLQGWAALSAEQKAKVRADLVQNAEALELVHQAAQRPACDFHLDYGQDYEIDLAHLSAWRSLLRLKTAAFIVALAEGRTAEGLSHWLDIAAMVRHQEGQRLVFSELSRLACLNMFCEASQALIQNGTMTDDQLASALAALDGLENRESFSAGLEGELVLFRGYVRNGVYVTGDLGFPGDMTWRGDLKSGYLRIREVLAVNLYCSPLGRPWRQYDEATGLKLFREGIGLLDEPFYPEQGRLSVWQKRIATPSRGAPLTSALLSGLGPLPRMFAWAEARAACLRIGLALERYRLWQGDYPEALDALAPDILPQVPADPFGGKPIRYLKDGDRVLVYSVGSNLKDDGGQVGDDGSDPHDIVFTLRPGRGGEGGEEQKP